MTAPAHLQMHSPAVADTVHDRGLDAVLTEGSAEHRNCGQAGVPSPRPRPATCAITLLALRSAYRLSGLFAKYTAQKWGMRHLAGLAEQVAVELIARAVETTGNPAPNPSYTNLGDVPNICICISIYRTGLLIEVWDSDATPPAYRDGHLSIVKKLCQRLDCYHPYTGGKVIRAELTVPPHGGSC
jgi:hypothetical protein